MRRELMSHRSVLVLGMAVMAGTALAQNSPELGNARERRSYALGVELGMQLRKMPVDLEDIDPELIAKGIGDAVAGSGILLTDDAIRAAIADLQAQAKKRRMLPSSGSAVAFFPADPSEGGEAFLASNRAKAGVVVLPSGLQYKILSAGTGKTPTREDTVVCHYRGTLIDGKEFDSSYARGQPSTFTVKGVIAGWSEALQLMQVGSKWQLFVPPQLAYGDKGSGNLIGPNATLIFEVELLAIR